MVCNCGKCDRNKKVSISRISIVTKLFIGSPFDLAFIWSPTIFWRPFGIPNWRSYRSSGSVESLRSQAMYRQTSVDQKSHRQGDGLRYEAGKFQCPRSPWKMAPSKSGMQLKWRGIFFDKYIDSVSAIRDYPRKQLSKNWKKPIWFDNNIFRSEMDGKNPGDLIYSQE